MNQIEMLKHLDRGAEIVFEWAGQGLEKVRRYKMIHTDNRVFTKKDNNKWEIWPFHLQDLSVELATTRGTVRADYAPINAQLIDDFLKNE